MATLLAPVDSREVIRCDHCNLVQFRTANNLCRKCKTSYDEEPEPVITMPIAQPAPAVEPGNRPLSVAGAIRSLRTRAGLSQRQLALRMNVPRTYVSKIENEKACPTLSSMQRLADALNVTVCDLLRNGEPSLEDQIRQLQGDEFIAELIPYLHKLNSVQWTSILNEIRALTMQTRRTA
jgi:transcriptional regulator with XRE-family HTH domain